MNYISKLLIISITFFFCLNASSIYSQKNDSLTILNLGEINIVGYHQKIPTVEDLPSINNTYIVGGKKNEVIYLEGQNSNLTEKTARQVFSRIPGIFVYDMDGAGNQINIATRGLDPHRSWEFNVRQNDVMINSDIYGYPASHYSLPLEAVEKIEIIRGTAALQYGAEFGGMINYKIKQPKSGKPFEFESINTIGSFGLFSSFNSLGGTYKKWKYYAYVANRKSDGYRDNSKSSYDAQLISINYAATEKLSLTAELGRSNYQYQISGPLTDSMFNANPKTSTRSRNFFQPEIWVPSFKAKYVFSENTTLELISSAVLGTRSSIQKTGNALSPDIISNNTYSDRQLDIDEFNSYTTELRLIQNYSLGKMKSTLATGIRVINNDLYRRQAGTGTAGLDANFELKPGGIFKRDLHFKTGNIAGYVENLLNVTNKWSISPGIRLENGSSDMSGVITYLEADKIPNQIKHTFILGGISSKYQINKSNSLYAGVSQAYRPVVFKDIIPETPQERTATDLKDALGYNAEIGFKGKLGSKIRFDLSLFRLSMNNRLGSLTGIDTSGAEIYLKGNVGNSLTDGIELYFQYNIYQSDETYISVFTSSSYMDGRYTSGEARDANDKNINKSLVGNKIESVPDIISRNGLDLGYKKFSLNILYSYTAKSYSDPFNTEKPNKSGTIGVVPSYGILDAGLSYYINNKLKIRFNANNIFDKQYYTKRPLFYPGPGIWSSDGRSFQLTFQVKI